ncbi:MAG: hypothetical protein WC716_12190 [Chitinophagaceae bacterium]
MNPKKITMLLIAGLTLGSIHTNAQIEKGTTFLGGSSAFNMMPDEYSDPTSKTKSNSTNFWINPRAGYYLSKSFALGLSLGYHYSRDYQMNTILTPVLQSSERERTQNSLGFSILARYNKSISKRFAFFAEGTLSTDILNQSNNYIKETNGGNTTVASGETKGKIGQNLSILLRPGIVYFVNPKFGIDATFASVFADYSNVKPEAANGNLSSKRLNMGYSFFPSGISLGAHYYIAPKPKKQIREEEE